MKPAGYFCSVDLYGNLVWIYTVTSFPLTNRKTIFPSLWHVTVSTAVRHRFSSNSVSDVSCFRSSRLKWSKRLRAMSISVFLSRKESYFSFSSSKRSSYSLKRFWYSFGFWVICGFFYSRHLLQKFMQLYNMSDIIIGRTNQ